MNESLRMQLSKEGSAVRCTLVSPYYIDTGTFQLSKGCAPDMKAAFRWRYLSVLQECLMASGRVFNSSCPFSSRRLWLVGSSRLCVEMLLNFKCHHLCTRPTLCEAYFPRGCSTRRYVFQLSICTGQRTSTASVVSFVCGWVSHSDKVVLCWSIG
jgi:hypothetical protein